MTAKVVVVLDVVVALVDGAVVELDTVVEVLVVDSVVVEVVEVSVVEVDGSVVVVDSSSASVTANVGGSVAWRRAGGIGVIDGGIRTGKTTASNVEGTSASVHASTMIVT